MITPMKLLNQAKNVAGDRAVMAASAGNYAKAKEWRDLAVKIDGLFREAVETASG